MQRLLYISTARKPLPPVDIEEILRISRRNNARGDITGLLVVGGRRFLQALEGPADAVEQTYRRICADPRHFAVVMLSQRATDRRMFDGWAMGYRAGPDPSGTALPDIVRSLTATIDDPNLRANFTGFADLHAAS
ncbi:BLUF domain-containing protein [Sphingomonas sp. PB2P19]|uniref:BLUF domain-containing protein n=1 Tax=Sphingomonas rhamnosi TaxID=3096156 RepID=UPI002FC80606